MSAGSENLTTFRLSALESVAQQRTGQIDAEQINGVSGQLHTTLVRLAELSTINLEDVFRVGKLLISCFPGEKTAEARDETNTYTITPLTTHPNPLIPHSLFYGLEHGEPSEEYLCFGAYLIGGATRK